MEQESPEGIACDSPLNEDDPVRAVATSRQLDPIAHNFGAVVHSIRRKLACEKPPIERFEESLQASARHVGSRELQGPGRMAGSHT